ncbi:hypothetical protein FH008_12555 [Listeria monocytogenes]|nr:hypothetical protein [Listeria monocytogenes]EBF5125645.1 hypothetical protein [Listeria monocytogenes]EBF5151982.1 hypothetical protein [Listeria monocytogenes]MBC1904691.1 hypothetical protein [Listeria innocua]
MLSLQGGLLVYLSGLWLWARRKKESIEK